MAHYKVEEIGAPKLDLGEGPHWDAKSQSLYFVDMFQAGIYRWDYHKNKTFGATVEGCTWASFIIPVKGSSNQFVVGDGTRFVLITWDGISDKAKIVKVIADLGEADKTNRFNDGKADSKGRLFAGTLKAEQCGNPFEINSGKFFRFDAKNGKFVEQFDKVFISNGLAWNDKTRKFYYADTGAYDVKEFDFDGNGDLSNGKVFFDMTGSSKEPKEAPDGMTIDTEGNIYLAVFHGSKVLKISPSGQLVQEITIPAKQVTSVAFGGPNLDELYVTTAKIPFVEPQGPLAGATFKVTGLGARGFPMTDVDL